MTKPGEQIPIIENLNYPFAQAAYCLNKFIEGKLEIELLNACLESYLLHARNIADLLRGARIGQDVTYQSFINKKGIKIYIENIDRDLLKSISEKVSSYASHLKPDATKQKWNDVIEAFPIFIEYRSLLIKLISEYPKAK